MVALGRLREAPQLEDLESLLEVQALAHVHNVDRAIDGVLLELGLGQRQVLGQVERGAVAAQDHRRAVGVVLQSELFIHADDHRAAGRSSSAMPRAMSSSTMTLLGSSTSLS